jgi:hypothetical protein
MKIVKYILPALVLCLIASSALAKVELTSPDFQAVAGGAGYDVQGGQALPTIIGLVIRVILGFLGIILIVLVIYAGFLWMTAGGDTKQVDKSKDIIKNAVMGLVVILLAYAITDFVISKIQEEIIK